MFNIFVLFNILHFLVYFMQLVAYLILKLIVNQYTYQGIASVGIFGI